MDRTGSDMYEIMKTFILGLLFLVFVVFLEIFYRFRSYAARMEGLLNPENAERLFASGKVSSDDATSALIYVVKTLEVRLGSSSGVDESVRLLLLHGADPNVREGTNITLLHYALFRNFTHAGVVRVLLEGGANPNIPDALGRTPIIYAAFWGHVEAGKLLLQHGADMMVRDMHRGGLTALGLSTRGGHAKFLRLLLEHDGNPNERIPSGGSLLHLAIVKDRVPAVKVLLEFGADTKAKDGNGKVPLEVACANGSTSCIFLLLQCMVGDGSITFKRDKKPKFE